LYRALETVRSLPVRLANWSPWFGAHGGAGREAASLLAGAALLDQHGRLVSDALQRRYLGKHSALSLAYVQAGFDPPRRDVSAAAFNEAVEDRVGALLRGPARDRLVARARAITSWSVTLLADAGPLAFVGFTAWRILRDYFSAQMLSGAFFVYSIAVLAIILSVELTFFSVVARICAWSARKRTMRDVTLALASGAAAFQPEHATLETTRDVLSDITNLSTSG